MRLMRYRYDSILVVGWLVCSMMGGCEPEFASSSDDVDGAPSDSRDAGPGDTTDDADPDTASTPAYESAEWAGDAWTPAEAPEPTELLDELPAVDRLTDRLDSYFEGRISQRLYIQTDKPLYRPGETIWIKTWNLVARDLTGGGDTSGLTYKLLGPNGDALETKRVLERAGHATNDFELDEDVDGGAYTIRVETMEGDHQVERSIHVADFESPRLKKELEFMQDTYSPGDTVTATVEVKRGTDQPLADHPLTGRAFVGDRPMADVDATTDANGRATIEFRLPETLETDNAVFGVRIRDAQVTESVIRMIPLTLDELDLEFYPEGGQLVEGLPSRVYFEAETSDGESASIEGTIIDGEGNEVTTVESYERGMGRFALTPREGETYRARLERPSGETTTVELSEARSSGCVLRHYDDFDGRLEATRMGVRCTSSQRVVLAAFMRNNVLDAAAVEVPEGEPAVVHLKPDNRAIAGWQGVTRVTLFDDSLVPLAERLVYRQRRNRLEIDLEPDREAYNPRDTVALTVRTRGPSGEMRPARVALSVVDDKVLSYADDSSGRMFSNLLLQPELPGEIERPQWYFDLEEREAARALDLLMGTHGYRDFECQMIVEGGRARDHVPTRKGMSRSKRVRNWQQLTARPDHPRDELQRREPEIHRLDQPSSSREGYKGGRLPEPEVHNRRITGSMDDDSRVGRGTGIRGGDAFRTGRGRRWAKVREFPTPDYAGDYRGVRNDFRDTVYWNPDIRTGPDGEATVEFPLSDAITSFRAIGEGVGAGMPGRGQAVFRSHRPFGMTAKLPLEVSADDRVEIPVTLMNERDEPTEGGLTASFGELLSLNDEQSAESTFSLKSGQRKSRYFTLDVTGTRGESKVQLEAETLGMTDSLERTVTVAPRGFPRSIAHSGQLDDDPVEHTVDVSDAYPGTTTGSIELYPNPVATMLEGTEGMLSKPHGCFEQVSSSNYPNIMIVRYLQHSGVPAPDTLKRARSLLEEGYGKLVGYELDGGGFSVFGDPPASLVHTAYGLRQVDAMSEVWSGVDDDLVERTAQWLLARRDRGGGFEESDDQLGYRPPSTRVTDAYVAYSLAEAGWSDEMGEVVETQARRARQSNNPYELALATHTLLAAGHEAASRGGKRLAAMQRESGAWTGASRSITSSYPTSVNIETTGLAASALLEVGGYRSAARRGIQWLNQRRHSNGTWGSTQRTVMALQAIGTYAKDIREQQGPGGIRATVDGETVAETSWTAGRVDPLSVPLPPHLAQGEHTLALQRTEGDGPEIPYKIGVNYRTEHPDNHPDAPLKLKTRLANDDLEMGEAVQMKATIENTSTRELGMTLIHVALPGGLVPQRWQLETLREDGEIAYCETRERDVLLYMHGMEPESSARIPLTLKAQFPGRYRGQASRAYPYYSEDRTYWTEPMEVDIER